MQLWLYILVGLILIIWEVRRCIKDPDRLKDGLAKSFFAIGAAAVLFAIIFVVIRIAGILTGIPN